MPTSIIPDNVTTKKKKQPDLTQGTNTGMTTGTTPSQVPYLQDGSNQIIPLSQDAMNQGNQQVLQTAQQSVVNQPNPADTALNQLTTQKTQELLRDPSLGFDTEGYKRNTIDQFNRAQSQAMEAARRKLGDTSQSGELQNEFLKNALYGAQQRADLGTQIDYDLSDMKISNLINALAEGRATQESSGNAYSNYINNLATVRDMAEGEAGRIAEERLQANEQAWLTSERFSIQDYEASQNNLDRQLDKAIADGDNETAIKIQKLIGELNLKMQTNDMDHDTKMKYLDSELQNAYADKDVERQKVIIGYEAKVQAEEDERNYGYETALTNLKGNIDKAIAEGNNETAIVLQEAELEYRVGRDIRDFALQQAALDLEKIGVDMVVVENQYNQILEAYGEEAADEYIASTLAENGVDMSGYKIADKIEQAMAALTDEMNMMRYQFASSHPEYLDRATGELTTEGMSAFNDYYNFTMYGELSDEMKEERRTAGFLTEADVPTAQEGDKFTISGDGYQSEKNFVPPGEYIVTTEKYDTGVKFFGTKKEHTKYFLQDADGNKYHVRSTEGGAEGNIISNLWAQ